MDAIVKAAELGYQGYEIDIGNFGGTGLGLQILPDRMSEENRQEIKKAREKSGIEICSLCLGALWHYPLAGSDEIYRKRGVEITRAAIELASFIGANGILLPLGQPKGVTANQAWRNTRNSLDQCLDLASQHRIVLALENVCSEFLLTANDLARMVDQVNSPSCKVYYDVANNTWLGMDPASEIKELGDRIFRVHVKNRSALRTDPESVSNSVGDPGIVNFQSVFQALKAIHYDDYLIVEVPTLEMDAEFVARKNLASLEKLISDGS